MRDLTAPSLFTSSLSHTYTHTHTHTHAKKAFDHRGDTNPDYEKFFGVFSADGSPKYDLPGGGGVCYTRAHTHAHTHTHTHTSDGRLSIYIS